LKALARNIAKTLPHHVEYEELVAFGQVGLAEAAQGFDASRGVSFTTFAHYRIRGAIFDGLRKMTWLPPAARRSVVEQANADEVVQETVQAVGAPTSDAQREQLARQFSVAAERLGAVFLASSMSDEERGLDPADERSEARLSPEAMELRERMRLALARLPEDLAILIRMLYLEGKSMSQVGEVLGKNKSTVCRRHAEAIEALREALGETRDGRGDADSKAGKTIVPTRRAQVRQPDDEGDDDEDERTGHRSGPRLGRG
jgi:RNA polymerase sigma factor for flagellar operon FliA